MTAHPVSQPQDTSPDEAWLTDRPLTPAEQRAEDLANWFRAQRQRNADIDAFLAEGNPWDDAGIPGLVEHPADSTLIDLPGDTTHPAEPWQRTAELEQGDPR